MRPNIELIKKYNVQVPRYTSYPTVPCWDLEGFSNEQYLSRLKKAFDNDSKGLSLYVHLPYCESLCTYCGCNTRITVNHKVEKPYIDALVAEWKMYTNLFGKRPLIKEMHFGGGTPTFFSPDNLVALVNSLKEYADFDSNADLSFEGHPNNTTHEHLKRLREVGFNRVSFGVQDFDPKVQDAINRIQPFENVKQVIEWSRSLGYQSVNVDLVYGLPFATIDTVMDTIAKTLELRPDRIAYYSYAHVPWVKPGQRKFSEKDVPADDYKRELFELGKEKFLNAGYMQIGIDHFALPEEDLALAYSAGTLHRNFMGYTVCNTDIMIGLGVSSISDCRLGFAQNQKTVEGYLELIGKNEFPIIKGHLQSEEDCIVKPVIFSLMCNMYCEADKYESILKTYPEIQTALNEFIRDGIIEQDEKGITIKEEGRAFMRNVCAVFDLRMRSINLKENLFSKAI